MTTKGGLQSRQDRQTLFAQRGQVATNARKGVSESLTAEATGDLLLHFDHAKISLRQMLSQCLILLSQMNEFFFKRHTLLYWGGCRLASPQRTR